MVFRVSWLSVLTQTQVHGVAFIRLHIPWPILSREAELQKIKVAVKKVRSQHTHTRIHAHMHTHTRTHARTHAHTELNELAHMHKITHIIYIFIT